MASTVLHAQSGRQIGSAATRRLRNDDQIPAVIYGLGMDPLAIAVDRRELRQATSGTAGVNTVLDITIDGTVYPSIIKDMQRHPVRRSVNHVDFLQVNLDEEIVVNVPVRLTGEAEEVTRNDGLVDAAVDHLVVSTTPRHIPDEFLIDISEMTMDSVITIADVAMPDGVTPVGDPEQAVVTVLLVRVSEEDLATEGAEEAEGEAAEGAEDAEGGDSDTDAAAGEASAAGDDAAE